MKRRISLIASALLLIAYLAKNYSSGTFIAYWAFSIPALAQDVTVVFLLLRVYRHAPIAQDETWAAFIAAMAGTHLFIIVDLLGVSLVSDHPLGWLQLWCSVSLTASYPLAIYSLAVLGQSFSILPEAKRLVTSGPYRWSRHPLYVLYVFWYLMLVGIGQSWVSLGLALGASALQLYRARCEERVLLEAFGVEYDEYRHRTMWIGRRARNERSHGSSVDS